MLRVTAKPLTGPEPKMNNSTEAISVVMLASTIAEFLRMDSDSILGRLAANSDFTVLPAQRDAWLAEISFLQNQLTGLSGSLFMEFSIPRMGRRVDVVLVIGPIVFVVEFKIGDADFDRAAIEQVWDYALDLKNFHEASHSAPIIPILVATGAGATDRPLERFHAPWIDLMRILEHHWHRTGACQGVHTPPRMSTTSPPSSSIP